MTNRSIKKLFILIAVCAYVFGSVMTPGALLSSSGLDSLLEEREQIKTQEVQISLTVESFKDVSKNDWFYKYLDLLVQDSLITGTSSNTFSPNDTFSLSQSCVIICRYLGLEDAANAYRKQLISKDKQGATEWYSGYVQVMYECKILDPGNLFTVSKDGLVNINKEHFDVPIKRHEFAKMITASFELDGSLRAKNINYEICGLGHEFISGGVYDMASVNSYKTLINDYDLIPEQSRQSVLKGYYNGIFCGDEDANFNPHNNLSRAEMAKILCVIYDLSQREFLQSDFSLKGINKDIIDNTDKFKPFKLTTQKTQELLVDIVSDLTVSSSLLSYNASKQVPSGFAFEIYVYSQGQLLSSYTLANRKGDQTDFSCSIPQNASATLLLRNLYQNGRIEGYIDVDISNGEIQTIDNAYSYPVF